ncbi:MAG TPA: twin transmembrane helix small protein [Casimicrobiaceae bacterium]|nr:twin transmembrane helix small protein [Casimicrobiaceae bacterium]
MRIFVVLVLIAIVASLFSALVFLYRDKGRGTRIVKALALRVALSVGLFAFLMIAYRLGWIGPGGLR